MVEIPEQAVERGMSKHICGYCEMGSHKGQVELVPPPHLRRDDGRGICVDVCLAIEISNLWRMGISTTGCCCGHGKVEPYIGVADSDIPKMIAMGYRTCPNETDPTREDGFYPKSIATPTPARCDELETVGHLWEYAEYYRDDRGWYGYVKVITEENPAHHVSPIEKVRHHDELVTRQNAEAVIAAKDARIAELEEHFAEMTRSCLTERDRNKVLEADNEAKDARMAELEALIDEEGCADPDKIDALFRRAEKAEADNKRLREALEPFANVAEHDIGDDEDDGDIFWPMSNARYSMAGRLRVGDLRRARAVLGEVKA